MKFQSHRIICFLLAWVLLFTACSETLADVLTLPAGLKEIGDSAFEYDQSLDAVVLPEGIDSIGSRAFAESSIGPVNLPSSLTYIAPDAFADAPNVSFQAEADTYAYDWLNDQHYLLHFDDENAYDVTVDMAVFEADHEIGLYDDPFVYYFSLADALNWRDKLDGAPQWTVTQTSGPEMDYWFDQDGLYAGSLCVSMPAEPSISQYDIVCSWDTLSVTSHVTVNYVHPDALPSGANIPNFFTLIPNEENVLVFSFEPSSFSFGSADRIGLENFTGEADYWFEGHELHIIPYREGAFTGYIALYFGNMYIGRTAAFWVGQEDYTLPPAVEASWTDCYTITWFPAPGVEIYTVYAYTDEACTGFYGSGEVGEGYIYFNLDVGEQCWFVVEFELDGQVYRSAPVTAEPLTPMPAPENLRADVDADGNVHLSWDAVEDAIGYRVYWSGEPDWTVETAWDSFLGEPGYDGLWIDEEETLYVWVCADNGDGPHYRTTAIARRGAELTDEMLIELLESDFDFHLSDAALDALTAEEYLADAEELRSAIADYNEALDNLIAFLDEVNADISFTSDADGFAFFAPDISYSVSNETLQLLASATELGDWTASDEGYGQLEIIANGFAYTLIQDGAGLFIADSMSASHSAANDPWDSIMDSWDSMEDRGVTLNDLYGKYQDTLDVVDILLTYLQESGLPEEALGDFGSNIGLLKKIKDALDFLDKMEAYLRARDMLMALKEIASHQHPTAMEAMYPYSLEISEIMNSKLAAARWGLLSEMYNNFYGAFMSASSLLPNKSTSNEKTFSFICSKLLARPEIKKAYEKARQLFEEIMRYDAELHYSVSGIVKDENGNPLTNVLVTCMEVSIVTGPNGFYSLEVPYDPAYLVFSKDGYVEQPVQIPVTAYVNASKDVTLKKGAWGILSGTVKDEFGDYVGGASVVCGEYSTTAAWNGAYSLPLPSARFKVFVSKEGYEDYSVTVYIPENDTYPLDPELQWSYGLHGTVTNESGPVPNASVSIWIAGNSKPKYNLSSNENGEFHYKLTPGDYALEVGEANHVSADLINKNYQLGFTVTDGSVKQVNAKLISIEGRYSTRVGAFVGGADSIHYIDAVFSWGEYTAHATGPTYYPFGFYCVSEEKIVQVHTIITTEVNGERFTKNVTKTLDLSSLQNGWTNIEMPLGRWNSND